ncbi:MAG TPA: manganese-dependent inorganic pyrophosphatase [Holophaga sp.]|nr:manganese-dependent inorganic pyrophosphatase [Holophaga sp.]
MNPMKTFLLAAALVPGLALFGGEPKAPAGIVVLGHKNPDTDSIVAAIAVAHLKGAQGVPAVAAAQGPVNPETRYVLDTFKLAAPAVETSVAGRKVILVDHADGPQAPEDLAKAELVGIVDHHKLGGLSTEKPLDVWMAPVGSTSTLVLRMYDAAKVPVPKPIAGGMLCAILSDTVIFKSVTTTPEDKAAAARLAKIAGVKDTGALGLKLFEVKSQLAGVPAKDLLKRDLKTFTMGGRKVAVAQLEVVDLAILKGLRKDLQKALVDFKADGYHSVMLMQTDIMKEATDMIFVSDDAALLETALGAKAKDGAFWLPGVMSRKKQVVPGLEKAFK